MQVSLLDSMGAQSVITIKTNQIRIIYSTLPICFDIFHDRGLHSSDRQRCKKIA